MAFWGTASLAMMYQGALNVADEDAMILDVAMVVSNRVVALQEQEATVGASRFLVR